MEAVAFVELLAAPSAKRRWSDEAKGQIVAQALVVDLTVNDVARRQGVKANRGSVARQGLAQQDPERGRRDRLLGRAGWSFRILQARILRRRWRLPPAIKVPVTTSTVDLVIGLVKTRPDLAAPVA